MPDPPDGARGEPSPAPSSQAPPSSAPSSQAAEASSSAEAYAALLDQPVQIVTAAAGGERAGCLVGFAGQCSLRPVRFAVWLSRVNRIWRIADRADHLGVHLLDPERLDLARLFGGETGDETDKFARVQWRWGPCGVPVLEEAAAWCVGAVLGRVDGGDHEGFLLDPVRAAVPRDRTRGAFLSLDDTLHLDPGHP